VTGLCLIPVDDANGVVAIGLYVGRRAYPSEIKAAKLASQDDVAYDIMKGSIEKKGCIL
jgi:hypothetical protein